MTPCVKESCKFSFEENFVGNIFADIRAYRNEAKFLLQAAQNCFASHRAADYAEPFPPFLLKNNEIRSRAGNLDTIKDAKEKGVSVKLAKKVNNENKDVRKGLDILKALPKIDQIIAKCHDEKTLKNMISKGGY